MGDKRARPVLIGPLSGPVHGVSIINNALRAEMVQRGLDPVMIDLSPGLRARGAAYHSTRLLRTIVGLWRILGAGLAGQRWRTVMHLDGGAGLIYNVLLSLALRLSGQAMLFYHHSSNYVMADSALMRLLLKAAGPAPQIFCSPDMARLFFDRYGLQGEALIINNTAWVTPAFDTPSLSHAGPVRLGFLSALSLEKGVGRAIGTLRTLRKRGVPAELALAGPKGNTHARAIVDRAVAEFGSALTIHDVVRGADKGAFLARLDYFLFPSLYPHETQSLVVPEALGAGVPVIAHDHRFVGEVVGEGGLLIPPTADYAAQAADWVAMGDLATRRAAARRQFAVERAAADGQVDRLITWISGAP